MRLYFTPGSPYARMARIVVLEKALQDRVATVPAKTRQVDSPYYRINPSGRVPYLVLDDGSGMEGSALICAFLDQIDGNPRLTAPRGGDPWEFPRLEASAHSTLEGLSVWARELRRPETERSPTVIAHEAARAARLLDVWEQAVGDPLFTGPLNTLQIVLACALGLEGRTLGTTWHASHPRLAHWYDAISRRSSFAVTAPPSAA
ncbi:MAG TPA: glutathione S-transferase N-terminal domain-containing protein [Rhodanobacteraceae bacterium]